MNALPAGYVSCGDGTYAKVVEFICTRPEGIDLVAIETLIRDQHGRLLRVERTKRALSLAAARRKKDA